MEKKAGFVALIGFPNAGKSTLLNTLIREKLSIVSPRPQTTRYRIEGIYSTEKTQIIFVDTPGFIKAEKGLNHILETEVYEAIDGSDIILLILEPKNIQLIKEKAELFENFRKRISADKKPLIIALNKSDLLRKEKVDQLTSEIRNSDLSNDIFPVSALKGTNIKNLINQIEVYLPQSEFLYDPEQIAIKSERFLVQEMIREQLFYLLEIEVPYECAVAIEQFDESHRLEKDIGKQLVRISAAIYVSRDSIKPILIGKGGSMIKRIGINARREIEAFLGCKVFLEIRVIVKKNWNLDRYFLSDLGYEKV